MARQRAMGVVLGALLLAACQPVGRGAGAERSGGTGGDTPRALKRIVVSITADLTSIRSQLNRSVGTLPGAQELEQLAHAGLTIPDHEGRLRPQLAEAVPTIENGLWKVLPDGRMETSWRIREGATWHDGAPFTVDDLLFSATLGRDPDVPLLRYPALDAAESVEAADARTFLVRWKRPFIDADLVFTPFGRPQVLPSPKHLLERPYLENKETLLELPYWGEGFIGTGPFKVRSWVSGSYLVLEAYSGYMLGRPKIDEIEVKFIADPNALVAHLLAGSVEQPIGRGLSFEQALQVREQWRYGSVQFSPGGALKIFPQMRVPSPPVVGDVRFRRALFHALDRQQLTDTLQSGLAPVAHTILTPGDRDYDALEGSVVRYEYDPRRAAQLIEGIGYVRSGDGTFRDAAGQRITVEIRSTNIDILQKTALASVDDWQRVGIGGDYLSVPPQRQGDREYRSTYPGFEVTRSNSGTESLQTFHSSEVRAPETRYSGLNYPNYANAELDALITRYLVTIPMAERMQVAGQIVYHITDQVAVMPMFHDATAGFMSNRAINLPGRAAQGYTVSWNAHEWDVKA